MDRHLALPALAALALAASSSSPLAAQSAAGIMEQARQAYEERMEGVRSYTVTSGPPGEASPTTHVRQEIGGMVVFLPESMVQTEAGAAGSERGNADPTFFYRPEFAERLRVEGTETVEGVECAVLVIDDFEGLNLDRAMGGASAAGGLVPREMRMCVDTDDYLLRKLQIYGVVTVMGQARNMASTMVFTDYREVDGVVHPWRVEIQTGAAGEADAALAQLRKQLESLPESQRGAIEEMIEQRMAATSGAGGGGIVLETTSVEVNRGG